MAAGAVNEHLFYLKCMLYSRKKYHSISSLRKKKYILFPLQFEPEGSLSYFAPEIEDQHALVETILRLLPSGILLCVKEHPNQCGALQLPMWKQLCNIYPSLRIIHGRESGRFLIKNAYLVISISSSLGMDALIMGKKVIVLGRVFYENFSNAFKIDSIKKLSSFINSSKNFSRTKNYKIDMGKIYLFAKNCWPGDPQPSVNLFSESNLNKLAFAINQNTHKKTLVKVRRR